ncbi:hypothetical protein BKA80DRAFT_131806 [Phyllosticta citrichinensis]
MLLKLNSSMAHPVACVSDVSRDGLVVERSGAGQGGSQAVDRSSPERRQSFDPVSGHMSLLRPPRSPALLLSCLASPFTLAFIVHASSTGCVRVSKGRVEFVRYNQRDAIARRRCLCLLPPSSHPTSPCPAPSRLPVCLHCRLLPRTRSVLTPDGPEFVCVDVCRHHAGQLGR